jgi:6-phosphogluconolactonase/glucosamine-6-phosphate isomerase/deaminase
MFRKLALLPSSGKTILPSQSSLLEEAKLNPQIQWTQLTTVWLDMMMKAETASKMLCKCFSYKLRDVGKSSTKRIILTKIFRKKPSGTTCL